MRRTTLVWTGQQLAEVDHAIASARTGGPVIVAIEGEPGTGKSSLLREVLRRSSGFEALMGDADAANERAAYSTLNALGVTASNSLRSPFQAAQALRDIVSHLQLVGPVFVGLDDIDRMDRESVESIVWLLRRASGDRLLVVATSRPMHPGSDRHGLLRGWGRLLLEEDVPIMRLDGLDRDSALVVIQKLSPQTDEATRNRLWEYTGGNPLFLRGILREHSAAELLDVARLPVPVDLKAALRPGLERFSPSTRRLIEVIAILGSGEFPLALVAAVAGTDFTEEALDAAERESLLERRGEGLAETVRIAQPAYRSVILGDMPTARRKGLHLSAARLVSSPLQAFEHRVAAADHYDDTLAFELDEFARTLHADGAFRDAGRLLRAASEATSEPVLRESRWLDSLFELLLARDLDAVEAEQFDISWARDSQRRALVQGFLLMLTARWTQAFTIFDSLDANQLASTAPLVQFRLLTLTGWTAISMGRPGEEVLPGLRRALELEALDPSVGSYLTLAYGQAQMRVAQRRGLWGFEDVPNNGPQSDTAPTGGRLVWRGAVYAFSGREDEAIRDLSAYTDGIRDGVVALGDGAPHALLGFALWMRGDLRRAAIPLRIARDAQYGSGHPMVLAVEALAGMAEGDEAAVLSTIREARDLLLRAPWPQAVTTALIVETIALRLFGSHQQRADFLSGFRADFGLDVEKGLVPPLRMLHLSLAEVWASDFESALGHARELEEIPINLPWRTAAVDWVGGLVDLGRGDAKTATEFFESASRAQLGGLPVHQALLFADIADAASALRDSANLERVRQQYVTALTALGLDRFAPGYGEENIERGEQGAVWSSLTDREREVVALLLEGLSYAQIAKELFLTRSTVAFHLSNAYAKTNTTSRHELVNLIRSEREA